MLLSLCRRHSGEPPDEEDYEHYFGPCLSSDPELLAVTSRQVFANFSAELMHTLLWQGELVVGTSTWGALLQLMPVATVSLWLAGFPRRQATPQQRSNVGHRDQ